MIQMRVQWDGPLEVDFSIDAQAFIEEISAAAPVGKHLHDRGVAYRKFVPRVGGRLRNYLRRVSNWTVNLKAQTLRCVVNLPYAGIINFGGRVGAVARKAMAWRDSGGDTIIRRSRGDYSIAGSRFVDVGFRRAMARTGSKSALHVQWKKKGRITKEFWRD